MRQSRESEPYIVWNREPDKGWVKSESLTFPSEQFSVGIDLFLAHVISHDHLKRQVSLNVSTLLLQDFLIFFKELWFCNLPFILSVLLLSFFPPSLLSLFLCAGFFLPLLCPTGTDWKVVAIVKRWMNCHYPTPCSLPLAKYWQMFCGKDVILSPLFFPLCAITPRSLHVSFFRHYLWQC